MHKKFHLQEPVGRTGWRANNNGGTLRGIGELSTLYFVWSDYKLLKGVHDGFLQINPTRLRSDWNYETWTPNYQQLARNEEDEEEMIRLMEFDLETEQPYQEDEMLIELFPGCAEEDYNSLLTSLTQIRGSGAWLNNLPSWDRVETDKPYHDMLVELSPGLAEEDYNRPHANCSGSRHQIFRLPEGCGSIYS